MSSIRRFNAARADQSCSHRAAGENETSIAAETIVAGRRSSTLSIRAIERARRRGARAGRALARRAWRLLRDGLGRTRGARARARALPRHDHGVARGRLLRGRLAAEVHVRRGVRGARWAARGAHAAVRRGLRGARRVRCGEDGLAPRTSVRAIRILLRRRDEHRRTRRGQRRCRRLCGARA